MTLTPPPERRLLRAKEVQRLLGLSPAKIYRLAEAGELGAVRLGERSWRFRPGDVEKVLGEPLPDVLAEPGRERVIDLHDPVDAGTVTPTPRGRWSLRLVLEDEDEDVPSSDEGSPEGDRQK